MNSANDYTEANNNRSDSGRPRIRLVPNQTDPQAWPEHRHHPIWPPRMDVTRQIVGWVAVSADTPVTARGLTRTGTQARLIRKRDRWAKGVRGPLR